MRPDTRELLDSIRALLQECAILPDIANCRVEVTMAFLRAERFVTCGAVAS